MEKVDGKSHAKLGPSGWDWWSNCPGAPTLAEGLPNTTSAYAAEGSVAHLVADRVLSGEIVQASDMLDKIISYEGFDILVDDEMVESVDIYVNIVRAAADGGTVLNEQEVPIGHLTGETGAVGTSDAIVISDDGKRMTVVDLKYGKGVRVNAEGNGQGRMYALGALHKFGPVFEDIEEVEIMIVQPRLEEGVSFENLNLGELEEFKDEVELAAGRVEIARSDPEAHLFPGEKQCKFCPVAKAGNCPALNAEVNKSLALISDSSVEDFADLTMPKKAASLIVRPEATNEKLAEFMRAVPLIEAAIAGVRGEVERRLFEGQEIPGYYLGEGRKGNRKWSDEEAVRKAIVKRGRLTKDQAYELKLISPAKAEKLLGKDVMALLKKDGLVTQPDGKPSVCQEGDKNPVYTPVTAEDFADLSVQSEAERLLS